ncbi:formate/nitrite transporter family protein [Candidatus Saccharibacteria bacterium]|nr:formate/nitrite transporter family protein [Candidatus Saccharibacteria bacterium]
MNTPVETLINLQTVAVGKATAKIRKLVILGFMAGMFIAFAGVASTIASMNLLANPETFGLGKLVSGLVFTAGLIMVVIGGAELFTGNSLMLTGLLAHKITLAQLLRNWLIVYLANFLGGFFVAGMIGLAGSFAMNGGLFGVTASNIALTKINLGFGQAFVLGLLCNLLVCLAVWLAASAKSVPGKILAIIFPIATFIICGFEHSIANMYYIPAGFFASGNYFWAEMLGNLVPVTLGNIVGGGLFVATAYHFALNDGKISLCKKSQPTKKSSPKKKSTKQK